VVAPGRVAEEVHWHVELLANRLTRARDLVVELGRADGGQAGMRPRVRVELGRAYRGQVGMRQRVRVDLPPGLDQLADAGRPDAPDRLKIPELEIEDAGPAARLQER